MTRGSVAPRGRSVAAPMLSRPSWGSPAPAPLTPLIGRRQELTDACAMLRRGATRLLTLTGPGGIGKTRLALEIAAELDDEFDEGVVWVPLSAVADADGVIPAIAASVGITGAAVDDRLVRSLRGERALVILDNFEHVVEAAPRIADLLAACPMLHAVTTSRSRLRIRGERVLPVPPLSLQHHPAAGDAGSDEPVLSAPLTLHSEAVTLFIERAQALVPDIDVSETNAGVVAEICRRLDGLPLAIELAAARVGHLPLRSLLERMDQRLPLLVGGDRDLPARLQTMRDAIAWSYGLLEPQEQLLLRRLAVFDGGFHLAAVEAVMADVLPARGGAPAVLDLVASLVEKSVIRPQATATAEPRYTMLETIREFASEQLRVTGETASARQAHAAYFLDLAEREELARVLPEEASRLDALEIERPNMRVALSWWGESGQAERGLTHAAALGGFWYARAHLREGHEWLERALAESEGTPASTRARALVWLGLLLYLRGDMDGAATRGAEGLMLCRALGGAWSADGATNDLDAAFHGRTQQTLIESYALYVLGVTTFHLGDADGAASWFDEGRATAEAIPDPRLAAHLVGKHTRCLGIVAGERSAFAEAHRLYTEALQLYRTVDNQPGIRRAQGDLAYLALLQGNHGDALARYREVLAQDAGPPSVEMYDDLFGAAIAAAILTGGEGAVRCLAASEALGEWLGLDIFMPSERSARASAVDATRGALGEATFMRAWAAGRALRPEAAIAELLNIAIPDAASPPLAADRPLLSERELDVLRLLVAGQTDRAIGEALFISHRTVEFHVSRILAKLGVRNRGGAIAAALAAGLVEPSPAM